MRRVHVLAEGQTEEAFLQRTLVPHLRSNGVELTPIVLKTKRNLSGTDHRGGVSSWSKIEREIRLLLRDSSVACVTTMLDYYRLPSDTPGHASRSAGHPHAAAAIEARMAGTISDERFLPHLTLHEFEALLFTDPAACGEYFGERRVVQTMEEAVRQAGGPELVNDGPSTAPSKRMVAMVPGYRKTTDGPTIAERIGLTRLREACPQFGSWVDALEAHGP